MRLRIANRLAFSVVLWALFVSISFAYSFVVFGDNRDGPEVFVDIITKVNYEKDVVMAFNTGDFVTYGRESEYKNYIKMAKNLKVPIYNVMGNHDAVMGGWKNYKKYFGHSYYSFDYQDSHFIVIDNAFRSSFDKEQFAWLKKDLAESKARHKFVFMHRPVFDPSEIYKDYIMSGREVTKELMRLFTKHKVDYVFAGHIHGYARAEREGVIYIVAAGAGAPLYLPSGMGGYYNYVKVTVENGKITDKVVKVYE